MQVPFFRPNISQAEIDEVVDTLRSGWLTKGPKTVQFEQAFTQRVGARYGLAVNSCTAALHLALEALGLKAGQKVLVPTMTFAATAEVVRYLGATPVLVDVRPDTLFMDLDDARRKSAGAVGIMPVHVAGLIGDLPGVAQLARELGAWVVEDAAHSFPAAWRTGPGEAWRQCGAGDSDVACFSFYANKTITTGEGGMALTNRADLDERMRVMSLHGISKDAWKRYSAAGSWYYEIVAPGFKYNLTDVAAALGIHQLARAEELRAERERIARVYYQQLADCDALELPPAGSDRVRVHAWHLFYLRLNLERLTIDRARFIERLTELGVACSVHWMPLHLHPYYRQTYGLRAEDLPAASAVWPRLVSLPLFPGMRAEEIAHVVAMVRRVCEEHRRAV